MKLFGGNGGHSGRTGKDKQAEAPSSARQTAPRPEGAYQPMTAPKPSGKKGGKPKKVKKQLTPGQKKKRIAIIAAVVLVLIACTAAAAWIFVRPPQANDPTIKDAENGDQIDVSGLLNSGTRIDDVFTFVIGAVDEDETRTDALMVATMDTKEKTINVMNIPRDTMCNNGENGAWRKINAAYATKKGIEQTKVEIERLMGFQPDKYVIVNFEGIAAIVDAIGGVDYEVPFRMEYHDPSQHLDIDLQPGMQHLTGKQTVEFLRWRHNNDYSKQYVNGDEGRVENQQKFLKELARQVLQVKNATKIPKIAEAVSKNVKTDFTTGELLWMGKQALQIDNDNLKFYTLPGYGAMSYAGSDPYKYSFFFPKMKETLELVNKYFNPYDEPITKLDMVTGPAESSSSGYSGGVSAGEDEDVWGDTGGGYYYEDDSDYSGGESGGDYSGGETGGYEEPDNSGGDYSGGETGGGETGGESGGDYSGGGESGGSISGGETGGGESGGESGGDSSGGETGGEGGGTVDPEA